MLGIICLTLIKAHIEFKYKIQFSVIQSQKVEFCFILTKKIGNITLGTWSDAHKQQNCEKEVFPSISEKISLFQAQGEQLNIPPRPIRRSSAPNFQGMNRPSSPTSYLYGLNRPGSPTYNSYRTGPPYRSAGCMYHSKTSENERKLAPQF